MPATYFKGKSGLGYRGDAILQMDWAIGQILNQLESLGLSENTLVIFTSDNGPVLDDGYVDGAVTQLGEHTPAGELRGGKYSIFEAGTRVPFLVSGPGVNENAVSDALFSQVDLLASLADLLGQPVSPDAMDSQALSTTLLGNEETGRSHFVKHAGTLAVIQGKWKYIVPSTGRAYNELTDIELGNNTEPQLYDLSQDISEKHNLANEHPDIVDKLEAVLTKEKEK